MEVVKMNKRPCNYNELFKQIEEDIKVKLPDKSRTLISEFVGYRHVELKDKEQKLKKELSELYLRASYNKGGENEL